MGYLEGGGAGGGKSECHCASESFPRIAKRTSSMLLVAGALI
jgi:hypothetical protein